MSDKSEPTADEKQRKQRELQAKYKALKKEKATIDAKYDALKDKEKTLIEAKLEIVKLAQRVTMGKSCLNSCPVMLEFIRERHVAKRLLARGKNSYGSNHQSNLVLEAEINELDATLKDILSNLDENLLTTDPNHKAVIKAIFFHSRSEGRLLAEPADADGLDIDDLIGVLG
ncbi:hypothetical protein KCU78_g6557, partial [Aureobasidium melanogenum]